MRCKENDSGLHRILDLWSFKSDKSNKRFIVEVEGFDKDFYGIKFYWKGVEKSKNRYSILTHDYEPRTIVRTCIEIMLEYHRKNPHVSFGFVAAPDLEADVKGKKVNPAFGNRRFRFYQRLMVSLFGPETFLQVADTTHTIYLMVNVKQLTVGAITIQDIEDELNRTYRGDFTLNHPI